MTRKTLKALPRVMLLRYQPELTHAVWIDFRCRAKTMPALLRHIRRETGTGNASAYRLITIHREVFGHDIR
jgi:hypothetical protein